MKHLLLIFIILLSGCSNTETATTPAPNQNIQITEESAVVEESAEPKTTIVTPTKVILPIADYEKRLTYKAFGEFIQDRFTGYHVGDDIEYSDQKAEVAVNAIADGTITKIDQVDGYGGLIIVKHNINDKTIHALYGHLDLSSASLKQGEAVKTGQFLANLGDDKSIETDGERKHLHFALYEGDDLRLQGYESDPEKVTTWLNPFDFFQENGLKFNKDSRSFDPKQDLGGDIFNISFTIPENMELEYIPSLKALNLFSIVGPGTARERSQILIRYFDASTFLTLPTVTIHKTTDLVIGTNAYQARRYDIEKKPGVNNFPDQPTWRNSRHIVTDFNGKSGFTRYYVVAANPTLDQKIYEEILANMTIK